MDNVFTEMLWKGIKYEAVYLKTYDSIAEAKQKFIQSILIDITEDRRPC